jgi:hypothetical protein
MEEDNQFSINNVDAIIDSNSLLYIQRYLPKDTIKNNVMNKSHTKIMNKKSLKINQHQTQSLYFFAN